MNKSRYFSFFYLASAISIVSGLAVFILKYIFFKKTFFGEEPFWFTPHVLSLHVILSLLLLISFGNLITFHLIPKLQAKINTRKKSGLTLATLFVLMILSGFIIQFPMPLEIKNVLGLTHSALSFSWITALLFHLKK